MANDEELLARFIKGDEAAFTELVSRHQRELFTFLRRFVNDASAADDLFQETFLQVYRSAESFDGSRRFRPWMFAIAANKARDYLRAAVRRRSQSLDGAFGPADSAQGYDPPDIHQTSVSDRLEQREDAGAVRRVLAGLPDIYREVLTLSYFHRFAYKQISEMLGIPLGTVKSRLNTAMAIFSRAWQTSEAERKSRRHGKRE